MQRRSAKSRSAHTVRNYWRGLILVLGFFVTMQGLLSILASILFLGGIYYGTARKDGVTLRGAIFNWPLVIVVGFVTLLSILL